MLKRLASSHQHIAVWCISKGRAFGGVHGPCQAESQQVIGAYTPITKQLWQDRLKQSTQNLLNSPPQKEMVKKRVNPISVIYPFHEDSELKQQVWNVQYWTRESQRLMDHALMVEVVCLFHSVVSVWSFVGKKGLP